ncbi:flagellar hook capping FlgD N-terminal domain-containing protein [Sulfurospirillum sp. UCH001]|jgi:flagellar basal-body rod modification protein FlgD|uniref:flagellar hook capping FlgD N-terminal domain-containing protein n=1 Tax=Sulfurospirillum sp. UCH001 TaxID=1581011 RepID=UPI0008321119|nr:flagellar hook capping FlgD N-terminal domain-containing protein [Sulfurospirillum sp. UCH001]
MATVNTKGYESLLNPGTASSTTTKEAAKTGSSDTLGKDDFLKLLLTELQHQDPTSPMDSDKILTQTSQLATLESATKTNTALENLSTQLKESVSSNATNLIGKMGSLGYNAITLSNSKSTYEVYFPTEIKDGTLTIKDANKNVIKTVDLGDVAAGKSGVLSFDWDGSDNDGNLVKDGYYSVTADYVDKTGASKTTQFGVYPVESIRYDNGSSYVKLGSNYYPISDVVEYYQP